MGYKQLIIARKDLNMSPGKLAAQVAHGAMAFLVTAISANGKHRDDTKHRVYGLQHYEYTFAHEPIDGEGVLSYRRGDLYRLAKEAHLRGDEFFHAKLSDPNDIGSEIIPCDPEPYYDVHFSLDADLMEQWIQGAFTKVVCEAKNKNHLLKAASIAKELGMKEGEDYFLIRDNCLTELEPEDEDGRTLTVIGFKPMRAEIIDEVGRKYQLWK